MGPNSEKLNRNHEKSFQQNQEQLGKQALINLHFRFFLYEVDKQAFE